MQAPRRQGRQPRRPRRLRRSPRAGVTGRSARGRARAGAASISPRVTTRGASAPTWAAIAVLLPGTCHGIDRLARQLRDRRPVARAHEIRPDHPGAAHCKDTRFGQVIGHVPGIDAAGRYEAQARERRGNGAQHARNAAEPLGREELDAVEAQTSGPHHLLAVAQPGRVPTPRERARCTTSSSSPALTMNRAPASTAASTWTGSSTDPAPMSASG